MTDLVYFMYFCFLKRQLQAWICTILNTVSVYEEECHIDLINMKLLIWFWSKLQEVLAAVQCGRIHFLRRMNFNSVTWFVEGIMYRSSTDCTVLYPRRCLCKTLELKWCIHRSSDLCIFVVLTRLLLLSNISLLLHSLCAGGHVLLAYNGNSRINFLRTEFPINGIWAECRVLV